MSLEEKRIGIFERDLYVYVDFRINYSNND